MSHGSVSERMDDVSRIRNALVKRGSDGQTFSHTIVENQFRTYDVYIKWNAKAIEGKTADEICSMLKTANVWDLFQ